MAEILTKVLTKLGKRVEMAENMTK